MRVLVEIRIGVVVEAENSMKAMDMVEAWGEAECARYNEAQPGDGEKSAVLSCSADPLADAETDQQALDRVGL